MVDDGSSLDGSLCQNKSTRSQRNGTENGKRAEMEITLLSIATFRSKPTIGLN